MKVSRKTRSMLTRTRAVTVLAQQKPQAPCLTSQKDWDFIAVLALPADCRSSEFKKRFVELCGRSGLPASRHRCSCTASTSLSPSPLENTGLSIVPRIRKGNCNFPSFNVAPDRRAMVLVKKLSLLVISANP